VSAQDNKYVKKQVYQSNNILQQKAYLSIASSNLEWLVLLPECGKGNCSFSDEFIISWLETAGNLFELTSDLLKNTEDSLVKFYSDTKEVKQQFIHYKIRETDKCNIQNKDLEQHMYKICNAFKC
jgi:hypothetical protein